MMDDDSGASHCLLFEDDILNMMNPRPAAIPVGMLIGRACIITTNGAIDTPVIKLEISLHHSGTVMVPWAPIQVLVLEGRKNSSTSE